MGTSAAMKTIRKPEDVEKEALAAGSDPEAARAAVKKFIYEDELAKGTDPEAATAAVERYYAKPSA